MTRTFAELERCSSHRSALILPASPVSQMSVAFQGFRVWGLGPRSLVTTAGEWQNLRGFAWSFSAGRNLRQAPRIPSKATAGSFASLAE